jgi:hypothetical protein
MESENRSMACHDRHRARRGCLLGSGRRAIADLDPGLHPDADLHSDAGFGYDP